MPIEEIGGSRVAPEERLPGAHDPPIWFIQGSFQEAAMALSVRTRFEVFKRDEFTCRYCGRKSPEVVLQVDHVVPVCDGGSDDEMNLVTSCWECNSGKSSVPLNTVLTGEDPHDKAILILERERQLQEYNIVLARERQFRSETAWDVWRYWQREQGYKDDDDHAMNTAPRPDINWLNGALKYCPEEQIKEFMDLAIAKRLTKNLRYVGACVRNWRYEHQANRDMGQDDLP